jgi:hypothetical protein
LPSFQLRAKGLELSIQYRSVKEHHEHDAQHKGLTFLHSA